MTKIRGPTVQEGSSIKGVWRKAAGFAKEGGKAIQKKGKKRGDEGRSCTGPTRNLKENSGWLLIKAGMGRGKYSESGIAI